MMCPAKGSPIVDTYQALVFSLMLIPFTRATISMEMTAQWSLFLVEMVVFFTTLKQIMTAMASPHPILSLMMSGFFRQAKYIMPAAQQWSKETERMFAIGNGCQIQQLWQFGTIHVDGIHHDEVILLLLLLQRNAALTGFFFLHGVDSSINHFTCLGFDSQISLNGPELYYTYLVVDTAFSVDIASFLRALQTYSYDLLFASTILSTNNLLMP